MVEGGGTHDVVNFPRDAPVRTLVAVDAADNPISARLKVMAFELVFQLMITSWEVNVISNEDCRR